MNPVRLLHFEVFGFLCALAVLLGYRALTGKLNLSGLLSGTMDGQGVGPERIQLLIATLAVSTMYVRQVAHGSGVVMPDVSKSVLTLFGSSGGVYAVVKAAKFWSGSKNT